uniref:Pyridoxine 5'-phosphate synthase n=1 Tax=candidate division WOR-3 bacterium TaxID=2052148 RepID=A0A7V0Z3Q5_UNCW3
MKLSVNIDHIATLREARREKFPDPVFAAVEAELGGADGVTVHLRGDRRHIKERDLKLLMEIIKTELNLEMAVTEEMLQIACSVKPDRVTLVPESPGEVTTQGGLDLINLKGDLTGFIKRLKEAGIIVGVFIDPDISQINEAIKVGAEYIEINTNEYSKNPENKNEIEKISEVAKKAKETGLSVHAGHGIDYKNIVKLLEIKEITGYSIGFAIVARAVFVGLRQATEEMVKIIKGVK